MKTLELLAPAKDLQTAREAILHGADAVYIGAPKFGARQAAPVSVDDICTLCREAHLFGVRIFVALNTILYDNELAEVEQLIWQLYRAGADALIIQDMGITEMHLPPIALHASTQCHNNDAEQLNRLEQLGFEQAVLARELNPAEIKHMGEQLKSMRLEAFIHGAICVSYSGRCYLSQYAKGRSANRGACAQMCRMTYDLVDARGRIIMQEKYLLSPKDMNRSEQLQDLIEAGVSSFKIEGRLKGIGYVKNVTAFYRRALDKIIARYPDEYRRSSHGITRISFTPDLSKSFNRGFTSNFFHRGTADHPNENIVNIHTPKSLGERMGRVVRFRQNAFDLDTSHNMHNGDGLLFITPDGEYLGASVNGIDVRGFVELNKRMDLPVGTAVFRNYDLHFEQTLLHESATRRIPTDVVLRTLPHGIALDFTAEGITVSRALFTDFERAKTFRPEPMMEALKKLGDTVLEVATMRIDLPHEPFIPLSVLSQLRRETANLMERALCHAHAPVVRRESGFVSEKAQALKGFFTPDTDYRANISNRLARRHYNRFAPTVPSPAYELKPDAEAALMTTKHCIRRMLGYCTAETSRRMPYVEPLFLVQGNERIRLAFDCGECVMRLYATTES